MKVFVRDLSGHALNYLVAKCEGYSGRYDWMLEQDGYVAWSNPIPE